MDYLTCVPPDVWLLIIQNLDVRGILDMRLTCRSLNESISSSLYITYCLELAKQGYEESKYFLNGGPDSDVMSTTASRLKTLETHVSAWRRLDWELHCYSMDTGKLWKAFLSNGILVLQPTRRPGLLLTIIELSSQIRNSPWRSWTVPFMGEAAGAEWNAYDVVCEMVVVEPLLDLMIQGTQAENASTIYQRLRFRSLRTGLPHPEAACADFVLGCPGGYVDPWQFLALIEGKVTVILNDGEGISCIVKDWQTGDSLPYAHINCGVKAKAVFISLNTVLVSDPNMYTIEMFKLEAQMINGQRASSARHVATYTLPQPSRPSSKTLRSFQYTPPAHASSAPFAPSLTSNSIHASWYFELRHANGSWNSLSLNFGISPVIFTDAWIESAIGTSMAGLPISISWSLWSPFCNIVGNTGYGHMNLLPVSSGSRTGFFRLSFGGVEVWDVGARIKRDDDDDDEREEEEGLMEPMIQRLRVFGFEGIELTSLRQRVNRDISLVGVPKMDIKDWGFIDDERVVFVKTAGDTTTVMEMAM